MIANRCCHIIVLISANSLLSLLLSLCSRSVVCRIISSVLQYQDLTRAQLSPSCRRHFQLPHEPDRYIYFLISKTEMVEGGGV